MLPQTIKAIMESAPFFVYTLDAEQRLTDANKAWFDMYGRLLGRYPKIGDRFPAEGQPSLLSLPIQQAYDRVLAGEQVELEDSIIAPASNEVVFFEMRLSPIYEEGKITGILGIAWDVTAKRRNVHDATYWERKYRTLLDGANDAIFLAHGTTGMIIYANAKAQAMVGYSYEELCQMHHSVLHPEEYREEYREAFQQFALTGARAVQLYWVRHKNGSLVPVDISGGRIEYEGELVLQGIFRDVSPHLTSLRKQKEFYETILNHIPIDVAVLDKRDKYIYLNPKAVRDQELRKWLIGKGILDYYNYRGVGTKRGEVKQMHLNYIRKSKVATKWEDMITDSKGHLTYLLRRFTPILNKAGEFEMSLFTGENITYLKQAEQKLVASEERYRNLVETTNDWIWETDSEGLFTYCSPQVLEMLGYLPTDMIGKGIIRFSPIDLRKEQARAFKEILRKGERFYIDSLECVNRNGDMVVLQTSGVPVRDGYGRLTHYRGIARDVTAQKRSEKLLQKALRELEDRNFELDSFVYKVSHDLRAPLSSMLGLLHLMQIESDPEQVRVCMNMMQERATKLDIFIKTVLAYSQNLNQKIAYQAIDFKQLVAQCFEELQYMPRAGQIKQILDISMPVPLYSDEFRLLIVFKNFISNAIKYQKPDRADNFLRIFINVTAQAAEIVMQDNGIGIEEAYLPRIFEMFYRATEQSDGSGLGLYIVRQALDKLGGTVRIESVFGEGTIIRLAIPNNLPDTPSSLL